MPPWYTTLCSLNCIVGPLLLCWSNPTTFDMCVCVWYTGCLYIFYAFYPIQLQWSQNVLKNLRNVKNFRVVIHIFRQFSQTILNTGSCFLPTSKPALENKETLMWLFFLLEQPCLLLLGGQTSKEVSLSLDASRLGCFVAALWWWRRLLLDYVLPLPFFIHGVVLIPCGIRIRGKRTKLAASCYLCYSWWEWILQLKEQDPITLRSLFFSGSSFYRF